jgi:hypothetical protein
MSKRRNQPQNKRSVSRHFEPDGKGSALTQQDNKTAKPTSTPLKEPTLVQQGHSTGQVINLPLKENAAAYLLEEAKLINERVKWYLEQQEKLETQGLFASGAVWAFKLSQPVTPAMEYVTWLPVILVSVLFVKSLLFTEALKEAFRYLERLEDLSDVPEGMGWAHNFRLQGKRLKRKWRKTFWIILILANLGATLVLSNQAAAIISWLRNLLVK